MFLGMVLGIHLKDFSQIWKNSWILQVSKIGSGEYFEKTLDGFCKLGPERQRHSSLTQL